MTREWNESSMNKNNRTVSDLIISAVLISVLLCSCGLSQQIGDDLGKIRLNIPTYRAGLDQVTHPSIIRFDRPWNGHRFWMAYTPYPFGNGKEENPSIAVSDDLLYWDTPQGTVNPIANNEETGCDELKDAHILYRDDLDRIEVWYLGRLSKNLGGDNSSLLLFRKYSYDGLIWSDYEVMSKADYLSPSVIWKDNKYQLWGIGYHGYNNEGTLTYYESTDGKEWINRQACSLEGITNNLPIWHGSVSYANGIYHFVYIESSNNSQRVLYSESKNGIDFVNNYVIIRNYNNSSWKKLYRPFLLINGNRYELFYGTITENNEWYITKSSGSELDNLIGINNDDLQQMKQLDSKVTDTHSFTYNVKKYIKQTKTGIRIELLALIPAMYPIHSMFVRRNKKKSLLVCAYLVISIAYTLLLLKPTSLELIIVYLFAALFLGLFMYLIIDKTVSKTLR